MGNGGYEILCWGDGLYLYRVLNGLALLAGGGNLARLALTGCIIGLTLACMRAVTSGGREFPVVQVVLGAVLYAGLFGYTVSVSIVPQNPGLEATNNTGGPTVTQDSPIVVPNVPWGAAVTGMVMSQAGVKLTQLFEQAFSTPTSIGVTNGGLAKSLSYLTAVRLLSEPYVSTSAGGNDDAFYHWRMSLSAYIHDCTIGGLNSPAGTKSGADIFRAADPLEGIQFESAPWSTISFLTDTAGKKTYKSCSEAFALIKDSGGDGRLTSALDGLMTARFGVPSGQGTQVVRDALATIGSSASTKMQQYMEASVINAVWMDALSNGPRLAGDVTSIIALRQADEQRTSDWVGGANMFLSSLRPVLSFFEALTYAVAPFLVFMLGLGERGWKILGSYFMLALWIQLWLPILAVCNLFLITGMEHVAAGLGDPSMSTSVMNVVVLQQQGLHWLALGALFVQITPFLALALLYGGAVTATTLAGRMAGQDYYNEKINTPDAVQPAPALQMGADFVQTSAQGVHHSGAAIFEMTAQTAASDAVSNKYAATVSASNEYIHAAEKAAGHTADYGRTVGSLLTNSATDSVGNDQTHTADKTLGSGGSTAKTAGQDLTQTATVDHTTAAQLSASGTTGGPAGEGGKVGMGAGGTDTYKTSDTGKDADHMKRSAESHTKEEQSTKDADSVKTAHALMLKTDQFMQTGGSDKLSASDRESLSRAKKDVESAQREYSEVSSQTTSLSSGVKVGIDVAGMNMLTHVDPQSLSFAKQVTSDPEMAPTMTAARAAMHNMGVVGAAAEGGAMVMALSGQGLGAAPDLSANMEANRVRALEAILPATFPGADLSAFHTADPHQGHSLKDNAPVPGGAKAAVTEFGPKTLGDGGTVSAASHAVNAGVGGVTTSANAAIVGTPAQMDAQEAGGKLHVDAAAGANQHAVDKQAHKPVQQAIENTTARLQEQAEPHGAFEVAGERGHNALEYIDDNINRSVEQARDLLKGK